MHLIARPGEQGKVRNVMKQKKRSLVRRIAALGLCLALTASALSPLAFAQDSVTVEAIPDASQMQPAESAAQDEPETQPAEEVVPAEPLPQFEDWNLSHIEARVIQQCLAQCSGERDEKRLAAQKLGISRATLYRKIQEYGL